MKDVRVDAEGSLHCPKCGGTSFDMARTGKAKVSGFLTIGVGVMLLPKRMKCLGCGTWSKSGNAKRLPTSVSDVKAPPAARTDLPSDTVAGSLPGLVNTVCLECDQRFEVPEGTKRWECPHCSAAHVCNLCNRCERPFLLLEVAGSSWTCPYCVRTQGTTIPNVRSVRGTIPNGGASVEPTETLADELEKLGRLRHEGVLSDEEFQQAKKRLLGG